VERFGSKRGLLLAFRARAADEATAHFATARAAHASPLEALRAGLLRMTAEISTTDELANHLALVQLELTDPDFHGYTLDHARTLLAHVRLLLATAADRGELAPCDIDRLARAVFVTYNGALLTWTVLRVGRLEDWLGRELDFLLKPWWRPVKSEIP
jgi:AcrR family transcriptional regulator